MTGKHEHVVGRQRLQVQGARAAVRQIIEQLDYLGRERRRPDRHDDKQRRKRQLPDHRQDCQQTRAVRPVDIFGHQQHRALVARCLHQVHDLLQDPVLDVASGSSGRPGAVAGQQRADSSPARIR